MEHANMSTIPVILKIVYVGRERRNRMYQCGNCGHVFRNSEVKEETRVFDAFTKTFKVCPICFSKNIILLAVREIQHGES